METLLLIAVAILGLANTLITNRNASKLDRIIDFIGKVGSSSVTPDSVCEDCKHTFSEHDYGVNGGCHGRWPGGDCGCDIDIFQPWRG
jgi:hypothetical protein